MVVIGEIAQSQRTAQLHLRIIEQSDRRSVIRYDGDPPAFQDRRRVADLEHPAAIEDRPQFRVGASTLCRLQSFGSIRSDINGRWLRDTLHARDEFAAFRYGDIALVITQHAGCARQENWRASRIDWRRNPGIDARERWRSARPRPMQR